MGAWVHKILVRVKKNGVGRNFSVGGMGQKNGMSSLDFGMGQKVDVGQKQHSLCSVLFHYIVSVPYMYFFSIVGCFFHLV